MQCIGGRVNSLWETGYRVGPRGGARPRLQLRMNVSLQPLYAGRGFGRRVTELPCELYTSHEHAPLLAWGTNLSESGIFLETGSPIGMGDDVVVSFRPAVAWALPELVLFAQVTRAARGRRHADAGSGFGLRFLDLSRPERRALARWLRPRERVPGGVRQALVPPAPALSVPPAPAPPEWAWLNPHPFACRVS